MAPILKQFANLLNPGPFQVPTGGVNIDWTHPQANSLVACWLPGLGFSDLVAGLNLVPASAASFGGITSEGVGFSSQAANTGAATTTTLSSVFQSGGTLWNGFTVRWRGYIAAAPQSFATFIAQTWDNTGGPPFKVVTIRADNTGFYQVGWNNGSGFQTFLSGSAIVVPSFVDIAATFNVNGTNTFYLNGKAGTSAAWNSAAHAFATTTSQIELNQDSSLAKWDGGICNIAQMWNRSLSAAEIQALYLAPYDLIVPAEYEEPGLFMPPPPPVFTLMPQIVM